MKDAKKSRDSLPDEQSAVENRVIIEQGSETNITTSDLDMDVSISDNCVFQSELICTS